MLYTATLLINTNNNNNKGNKMHFIQNTVQKYEAKTMKKFQFQRKTDTECYQRSAKLGQIIRRR